MADQDKTKLDPKKAEYVTQLQKEKETLGPEHTNSAKLIADEIDRVQTGRELNKLVEVHQPKPTKMTERVLIPVKQFPKFNFVGKLLGPKGNSLKRLQEETGTKIAILGRGSMKDPRKEDEYRKEGGKYSHLNQDLHALVEVFGLPNECHMRMSHALNEIARFLIPDNNDDIRQQQFEEMMYINGDQDQPNARGRGRGAPRGGGRGAPRGRGVPGPLLATPGPTGRTPGSGPPARGSSRGMPSGRGGPGRGAPPPGGRVPPPPPPPMARAPLGSRPPAPMSRPPAPMSGRSAPAARSMDTSYDQDQYYGQQQSTASYGGAEESYGGGYEDTTEYTDYSQNYTATGQSETEYYDYGHGSSAEDSYANDGWNQNSTYGKAPMNSRTDRGMQNRSHPYAATGTARPTSHY